MNNDELICPRCGSSDNWSGSYEDCHGRLAVECLSEGALGDGCFEKVVLNDPAKSGIPNSFRMEDDDE